MCEFEKEKIILGSLNTEEYVEEGKKSWERINLKDF